MEGGAGSGGSAALAELSSNDDPAPPTREAPAKVAAPLRKSRLSTKVFLGGAGTFSLGIVASPALLRWWACVYDNHVSQILVFIPNKEGARGESGPFAISADP
jgi:hypothetical protein